MEQTLSLSTHILDISKGQTAAGVVIKLYKYENELWFESSEYAITDQDGRFRNFRGVNEKVCGIYKLKFEVGEYFTRMGTESLYPFIEITFEVTKADQHYHIPLLLSPYGYSTYRGS